LGGLQEELIVLDGPGTGLDVRERRVEYTHSRYDIAWDSDKLGFRFEYQEEDQMVHWGRFLVGQMRALDLVVPFEEEFEEYLGLNAS